MCMYIAAVDIELKVGCFARVERRITVISVYWLGDGRGMGVYSLPSVANPDTM